MTDLIKETLLANDNTNQMGSALETMLDRRNQFLTNGNIALKTENAEQTVEFDTTTELPDYIKDLTLDDIFKDGKISDEELEKLKNSHANDNFPNLPTDPNELTKLLSMVETSVKTELIILKAAPLTEEEYAKRYNKIQLKRAYQLLTEYMIGQDLKKIKAQKGLKKSSKRRNKDKKETKADIIAKLYPHLGPRQIRDFQKLELNDIWEAIKHSFSTGQDLTRSMALSMHIKRATKDSNNSNISQYASLRVWRAKEEDFETEFKTLALTEEIGATSLFANIGCGTSLLEEFTKIRITLANELKPRRVACHKRLFPNCEIIEGSIDDKDIFDKIVASHKAHNNELVFISCPCQDASSYNTAKSKGEGERSALFKASLDYIEETNPKYIVFENVALWLTSRPEYAKDILKDKTIGEYVVDELNRMGYNVTSGILSAADYETAENRERAIILACKKELGIWKFPKKHKFRPTVYEVIGLMKSIEAGEYDPENIWHYGLPLENHEIEFLSHTPVGASAWNNSKKYQPKNKDGSPAGAEFKATYTRINPAFPCPVIESGSGQIGDVYSVHFGRPLSDGVFSDSRVLSIAEILRIIGLKDNFLDPLIDTEYSEDMDNNQRGLFFENNMLLRSDETFIRDAIGEHVCPKFMLNLVSTMPIPSNDNIK